MSYDFKAIQNLREHCDVCWWHSEGRFVEFNFAKLCSHCLDNEVNHAYHSLMQEVRRMSA